MLGRSCLYEIICLLQVATVESVPAGIKSNANLKILLEKSTSEMVTQVFSNGYADQVTNNPGRFRGWFFQWENYTTSHVLRAEFTQKQLKHS